MARKIICVVNDIARSDMDLKSEHGLSFWIETAQGIVLFDTGQTNEVLTHNLAVLGLAPQDINALALSHAHYDHTGGLEAILTKNLDLTIYAHPDIFRQRYSLRKGEYQPIGLSFKKEDLSARVKLNLGEMPTQIFSDLWTTGEIRNRPEPEGRSATHFIQSEEGWQPDPYRDDLSLVLKTESGLIVICGCCHAGLINTLLHVKKEFHEPIISVVGGTHLMTADGQSLIHVVKMLNDHFPNTRFFVNHCTGDDAYHTLVKAFGSRVVACPAGTVIDINLRLN